MVKLVGCIFIIISGSLTGFRISSNISHRLKIEKTIYRLYCEIDILLQYSFMPFDEIISHLNSFDDFKELDFLQVDNNGINVKSQVLEKIRCSKVIADSETRNELILFFTRLGTTDIQGQLSYAKLAANECAVRIQPLEEMTTQRCKLSKALGILGGTFIAIMIV